MLAKLNLISHKYQHCFLVLSILEMWTIQVSLILSFLCGRGLGGAARGECEWGVSLCEIGDPLNRISTCNFESPLTTLSGGIEMQQFSAKVQDIIKTLTDQPVNTQESTTVSFQPSRSTVVEIYTL